MNEDAERRAILDLIDAESAAYWRKDFEAWAQCWIQDAHIRRVGWWSLGGVTYRQGWAEIGAGIRKLMEENPQPNRSEQEVRRENVNLRIGSDIAWMTFDQHAPSTGEEGMDMPGLSREARIFEKRDGSWKIAYVSYLHRSLDHIDSALLKIDARSRVTWSNQAAREAIAEGCGLTVSSGRLRATHREADHRMQAAVQWAAELNLGVESRKGALPVILEGGDGEPASICWIIADSGDIIVSINDEHLPGQRLQTAAVIYGLSPSQIRLAERIISGETLRDAAERLSVSLATVRTQLERMFDKTGVRNQTALVRALLTVAAPLA